MQAPRHLITAAVAAVAALAAIALLRSQDAAPSNAAGTAPLAAQPAAARLPAPPSKLATAPAQAPAAEPALTEQIDRLVSTHDPVKAFAAYTLISDCATFNRFHERAIYDLAEVSSKRSIMPFRAMTAAEKRHDTVLCTGMSERTRLSRLDYLAVAARAGVNGAAVRMAEEGPFGDRSALTTRPDDPLVREWKQTVLDQLNVSAEAGDMGTLAYLWMREWGGDPLTGRNPALAYRHLVAQGLIMRELTEPGDESAAMLTPDGGMARSIDGLSTEARAAELAAAQHIADTARARRERDAKRDAVGETAGHTR